MTEADAVAKEKAIWDTIKIKDYDAFANMLAEDQLEVTGEGVFDKAGSIASVKEFEPTDLTFSDWKFLSIDKDAYLIIYSVNMKGKYKAKSSQSRTGAAVRPGSIGTANGWRCITRKLRCSHPCRPRPRVRAPRQKRVQRAPRLRLSRQREAIQS